VSVAPCTAGGSVRTLGPNHTLDASSVNAPGNSTGSDKNASIAAFVVGKVVGKAVVSAKPRDARLEGWSTLCASRINSVGLGSRKSTADGASEGKNIERSCGLLSSARFSLYSHPSLNPNARQSRAVTSLNLPGSGSPAMAPSHVSSNSRRFVIDPT
jgi:hypothetical protein